MRYLNFLKRCLRFLKNQICDIKYCGGFLGVTVKTKYKNMGANDSGYTDYGVIKYIFDCVKVNQDDVLVDIGCGKGRVIGWWLKNGYRNNKIVGIELDSDIANDAVKRFKKYSNVSIINGDAVENIPIDATYFYLFNPFNRDIMIKFKQKLFDTFYKKKNIKIIYHNCCYLDLFQNDEHWEVK